MSEENRLWMALFIMVFGMFVIGVIGGNYDAEQDRKTIETLVAAGADPIHAKCAVKRC
jgi:hypothetical protein